MLLYEQHLRAKVIVARQDNMAVDERVEDNDSCSIATFINDEEFFTAVVLKIQRFD